MQISDGKMMTADNEIFPQIKAMGAEALYPGIEMQLLAAQTAGILFQPIQQ